MNTYWGNQSGFTKEIHARMQHGIQMFPVQGV